MDKQAFPCDAFLGMTLRDYFATKAMQGILCRTAADINSHGMAEKWASQAYKLADAMLKQKEIEEIE